MLKATEETKNKMIVSDAEMQERIIEDIRELDADMFKLVIEFLYPVKAELTDDGKVELKPNDDYKESGMTLLDVF